jgi:hypothetical protein
MPRTPPSEDKLAEIREFMNGMTEVRLDVLSANAAKYAEALGAVRAALKKAGFSTEESMQIILKIAEQQGRRGRPMHGGEHSHPDK